jgi:hypothetical protein
MATVTVKRISLGSFIKWHAISALIFGFFTGIGFATMGYLETRQNLSGYLVWYVLGIPALYFFVGIISGIVFVTLYNTFNLSFGSYELEIEIGDRNESEPPPPPASW